MEEFKDEEGKQLFDNLSTKLCMCECEECNNRSPHPIYSCFHDCVNAEKMEEKEKLQIGLYKRCLCSCATCVKSKKIYLYMYRRKT